MKKVSIIIPFYNTAPYLNRCLNSVINQTYKNLEIILINDGSTDNSREICTNYKNKDTRITIINKPHGGVSDAKNYGLKYSTGDYIGFVDSDDFINPHMFEFLVKGLEEYNTDISMCNLEEVYSSHINNYLEDVPNKYILMSKQSAMEELLYDKNIGNYMTTKLFKKELLNGIEFPLNKLYEDIHIAYKLFLKSKQITYLPTVLYYYFQREESIVNKVSSNSIMDYITAIFDRYFIIKNCSLSLDLYNVYSLFNVIFKMCYWSIKINDLKLIDYILNKYYIIAYKELNLINKVDLINLFTPFEKESYYLLNSNSKTEFIKFIKSNK